MGRFRQVVKDFVGEILVLFTTFYVTWKAAKISLSHEILRVDQNPPISRQVFKSGSRLSYHESANHMHLAISGDFPLYPLSSLATCRQGRAVRVVARLYIVLPQNMCFAATVFRASTGIQVNGTIVSPAIRSSKRNIHNPPPSYPSNRETEEG